MKTALRAAMAALLLASATGPGRAAAAACCTSATSFGVGRLLAWEDAAAGVRVGHSRSLGAWDGAGRRRGDGISDGLTTVEPWAIVRLAPRLQLQARAPVAVNDRQGGGRRQAAGGLGDVGAGLRIELLSPGEYAGLPAVAFTVSGVAPTGRRVERTRGPLFAGATGRGAWGGSLAAEVEQARMPWFVRLEAGLTVLAPFRRADGGARQQDGPLAQVALGAGLELVPEEWVAALALQGEWEAAHRVDGAVVHGSDARAATWAASASWRASPRWTLVGTLAGPVWLDGGGKHRDGRLGFTLGVRHGFF